MNLFCYSSFESIGTENTRTAFSNTIPRNTRNDTHIQFRSIQLDTEVSILKYTSNPRILVSSREILTPTDFKDNLDYLKWSVSHNKRYFTSFKAHLFETSTITDLFLMINRILASASTDYEETNIFYNSYSDNLDFWLESTKSDKLFYMLKSDVTTDVGPAPIAFSTPHGIVEYIRIKPKIHYRINAATVPKLIKVYCRQVDAEQALTLTSLNLLCILPYERALNYRHEIPSIIRSRLSREILQIDFRITDEKDTLLFLLTGAPSFVHVFLESYRLYKKMTTYTCHFNSADETSLKYRPGNSVNDFTQILAFPLDTRNTNLIAALQCIYLPPGMHNVSKTYTSIGVSNSEESIARTYTIPSNFYTEKSFGDAFTSILANTERLVMEYEEKYMTIYNVFGDQDKTMHLNPQTAYMLGAVDYIYNDTVKITIPSSQNKRLAHPMKLGSLQTRMIKIVCDMMSASLIAGSYQPVLRIINLEESTTPYLGDGIFLSFTSKNPVMLEKGIYDKFNIQILDENDHHVQFNDSQKSVEGLFYIESQNE